MVNVFLGLIRAFLGAVLMASVLLICANAFGRYALHQPIIWAEEVLGYALVWLVYLGAILVTVDRSHLTMDLLSNLLGPRARTALEVFGALVFAAVGGVIIFQGWSSIAPLSHRSQVADLPMNIMHGIIPVSFVVMIAVMLLLAIGDLRRSPNATDTMQPDKEPTP